MYHYAGVKAKLFRDFFSGSWLERVIKNGEFQREISFNWPEAFGKFSSIGTESGRMVPPGQGVQDNTRQVAIAGWRHDTRRWYAQWYNEFGGYGELQWSSQEEVNGITVLHGSLRECKQESDDPTDHIAMCELLDQDNYKYTIRSYRKGLLEIEARRIRTAKELNALLQKQSGSTVSFEEIGKI